MERTEEDEGRGLQWFEVISWQPRAAVYHKFLSKKECEHLINLAKPHMRRSVVIDGYTGMGKESSTRTSTGTFLSRGRDEIIRIVEKRISNFTFIPVENGEALQVLHYDVGQKYDPHYDYFTDQLNLRNGGNRLATLLMYLSDIEEGGETVFPRAKGNFLAKYRNKELSVKPKMGDALLFWNMKPDATPDPSSFHGSCPVIKGNKWVATKWMRVNECHG